MTFCGNLDMSRGEDAWALGQRNTQINVYCQALLCPEVIIAQ